LSQLTVTVHVPQSLTLAVTVTHMVQGNRDVSNTHLDTLIADVHECC